MFFDIYNELVASAPDKADEILGISLDKHRTTWISIDSTFYPALMLPAKQDDIRADIVLRAVDVEFSRFCTIENIDESKHSDCFTIIRLKDDDPDIIRLFLRILEERFGDVSIPKSNAAIAEGIQEIASLFSQLLLDTRDTIGLWGELFTIANSSSPVKSVQAWTSKKAAKYDFVTDSFVLDVKATTSHAPKHRFSLEQVRPVGDYDAYILSLCLVEQQAGTTVGELMDNIAEELPDGDQRNKFLRICLIKGGKDIYSSDLRLQSYPDPDSIRIFNCAKIPVPQLQKNDPVTNVRFDVDLTDIEALPKNEASTLLKFVS